MDLIWLSVLMMMRIALGFRCIEGVGLVWNGFWGLDCSASSNILVFLLSVALCRSSLVSGDFFVILICSIW